MRRFLVLLPLLLLLAGCFSEEDRLIGKWRGKVSLNPVVQSMAGLQASQFANMLEPQLDLRPDKTFALSMPMGSIEGKWELKDKEVILTPNSVMGMPADQVKNEARKAMDHASGPMGMPFGMSGSLPDTQVLHVKVLDDDQKLSLDPTTGMTMFGSLGKMTFTKV